MKKIFITILLVILLLSLSFLRIGVVFAEENSTINAKAYVLADFYSGEVVESKNETECYPIASMVKITTLSLIFDAINDGRLAYDDDIIVSEYAFSMGGSQAFLDKNATYKAEELIKSVIVASANDSCVALAEHLEGSVDAFVDKMNEKARDLGMVNTNYVNCTGLPAPNGYSCAKDVLTITRYLMQNDKFFEYAKVWMYDIQHPSGRTTSLTNTNKLVRFYHGMDGGKTGFTKEALSCLSCKATKGETSLVCVVIGAPDAKTRNASVSALLNKGFSTYENKSVVQEGENVEGEVCIKNAKEGKVELSYKSNLKTFSKKNSSQNISKRTVFYDICAPVKAGTCVGKTIFTLENGKEYEVEIVVKNDIECKNYGDFVIDFSKNW
ncbi:MAG: D-alanyl-D-alanine carboxypeptidase [Clostridiales bacterium]|nr:D-alanyl-D-alanine carboxypeptidase [Clostridiales bacterium]